MLTGFDVSPQASVWRQSDCSKRLMSLKVMQSIQVESASRTIYSDITVAAKVRAAKEATTRAERAQENCRHCPDSLFLVGEWSLVCETSLDRRAKN